MIPRRLYVYAVVIGIIETSQLLVFAPFLSVVSSIIDGKSINSTIIILAHRLNIEVILMTTASTVIGVVTLNIIRARLSFLRLRALHGLRENLTKALSLSLKQKRHLVQEPNKYSELLLLFSTEIENYVSSYAQPLTILYQSITTLLLTLTIMVIFLPFSIILGLILIVLIYAVVTFVMQKKNLILGETRFAENEKRMQLVSLISNSNLELGLFGLRGNANKKLNSVTRNLAAVIASAHFLTQAPKFLIEAIVFSLLPIMIYTFYSSQNESQEALLYVLGMTSLAFYKAIPALQGVYQNYTGLRFGEPIRAKFHDFKAFDERQNGKEIKNFSTICVSNLNIRIGNTKIIENINFNIHAGEKIAIVGESGVGKTTLMHALMGLLPIEHGSISIDGMDLNDINTDSYFKLISYVPSKNLDFRHIQEKQVTNSSENRSSGELQRELIQLAISKGPQIIFVDELTSSQDLKNQNKILSKLTNNDSLTVISIVHRLETLIFSDKIYKMEKNSITEYLDEV